MLSPYRAVNTFSWLWQQISYCCPYKQSLFLLRSIRNTNQGFVC